MRKNANSFSYPLMVLVWLALIPASLWADGDSDFTFYIKALENIKDEKFAPILIDELENYIHYFPQAENLDEMQFKIASIYDAERDRENSFLAYLELVYLYPNSENLATAKDKVRSILMQEGDFKPLRDKVDSIINPSVPPDTTLEMASYMFLRDMFNYHFERVARGLVRECNQFLANYPNSTKSDEVLYWKGEVMSQDKRYREAISAYMKITFLYPQSILVTASKLKIADLYSQELGMQQNAILTLEEFLVEYPDDPQAGLAMFRMAQIIENERNKYVEALNTYLGVAEKYPKSLEAVPALFEAARLYEDKFKEYAQAIRVYTQIVRDFGSDIKAPFALTEAGRIYEKRLKDYGNAANVYDMIFEKYPQDRLAPEYLYKAGEIYEKELKDNEKALVEYRKVTDNFPKHDLAEKAGKRIEKITEEMNKQK